MASRAHVHDYYAPIPERPRRAVRYPGRSDPVILPPDRSSSANAVLIASGLIATAVILGGSFAVYAGVPAPPMAETPTPELASAYQLDDQPLRAQVLEALDGPARAVTSVGTTTEEAAEEDAGQYDTFTAPAAPVEPAIPDGPAITPRRTAPGAFPAPTPPEATPDAPPREPPYPDPITTPPDAVAPPGTNPELPQPLLDPENPYR